MKLWLLILVLLLSGCGSLHKVKTVENSKRSKVEQVHSISSEAQFDQLRLANINELDLSNYVIRIIPSKTDTTPRVATFRNAKGEKATVTINPDDEIEISKKTFDWRQGDQFDYNRYS